MTSGIPDVNCTAGWIELKHLNTVPKRDTSLVIPNHFEPEQRNWLRKRCLSGGRAWLLLRVGRVWLLCWGRYAADNLGVAWTVYDLLRAPAPPPGVVRWSLEPSSAELIHALLLHPWQN